jgi:hypothetical protein
MKDDTPDPLANLLRSAIRLAGNDRRAAWLKALLDHGERATGPPPEKKATKKAKTR